LAKKHGETWRFGTIMAYTAFDGTVTVPSNEDASLSLVMRMHH